MRLKSESRRQAIMDVAETLFHEKGFEQTSMDQIKTLVGMSKATLYNYFESKEELFLDVMHRFARDIMMRLYEELDPAADIVVTLQRFGEELLEFLCQPKIIAAQRVAFAESGRAKVGKDFYEYGPLQVRLQIAKYMQACMQLNKLRQDDPELTALYLLSLLQAEMQFPLLLEAVPVEQLPPVPVAVNRALAVFMRAYGI